MALRRAFTLVELLVVIAILAMLVAALVPSLHGARLRALQVKCISNQRQLGQALQMYAHEFRGRALPLAYTHSSVIGDGPSIFWWGTDEAGEVNHTRGFIWHYLNSDLRNSGVFECPAQPWGTYAAQGQARAVTSTYGYNGYFLSPPHATAWSATIGHRPWQRIDQIRRPDKVLAFADTLIVLAGQPRNTALLDPPMLFQGAHSWTRNLSPTTSFRHVGRTAAVFVDGHASVIGVERGRSSAAGGDAPIGSIGPDNDPHYVPDWRDW